MSKEEKTPLENQESRSCCSQNPYDALPPTLQPKNKTWKTRFLQVTCPDCGLDYWTDREIDHCNECQKISGIANPKDAAE
jgi:hypothetical protein